MPYFNLQMFADGDISGEATGAVMSTADAAGMPVADGEAAGAQAVDTAGAGTPTADERLPYDRIREMYAEDINKTVKNAVEKRLRREKDAQGTLKKLQPLVDRAAKKYSKDAKDIDAIMAAVSADRSYYEELAERNGTTPEIEEMLERSAAEARSAREALEEREEADRNREFAERIGRQVLEVRERFPDFDLQRELDSNPQFAKLAQNPSLSLLDAYKATRFDEEIAKAMQNTAHAVEANVVNNIRSGAQVAENGLGNTPPATVKKDISKLSLSEIQEYIERARRGEVVTF